MTTRSTVFTTLAVAGALGAGVTSATCGTDDSDPCAGIACSSRGFCLADQGNAFCACIRGYHPILHECLANDSLDPCTGIDCGGHGACSALAGDVTCLCETGYHSLGTDDPDCADLECDLVCIPDEPGGPDADADADTPDEAHLSDDAAAESVADPGADADADADEAEATVDIGACPNGFVDPGEECDGNSEACGDCDLGTRTCTSSCTWGACDWDGTCHPGDSESCGSDCTTTCTSSCYFGACLCDSSSRSCTASDGCPGTQDCTDGGSACSWSTCTAPPSCDFGGELVCAGDWTETSWACPSPQVHLCECTTGGGFCHMCHLPT